MGIQDSKVTDEPFEASGMKKSMFGTTIIVAEQEWWTVLGKSSRGTERHCFITGRGLIARATMAGGLLLEACFAHCHYE